MKEIISKDNPKIKLIKKLAEARDRKKEGLIIIEGSREIELAIKQGLKITDLFLCKELLKNLGSWLDQFPNAYLLPANLFKQISYKENPEGIIAIAEPKTLKLKDIKLSKTPLVIILENIEKPGNLGAILRTAYAAKVDAIIINDAQTDIYNPNVIRSSMGHLFTNQVAIASIKETTAWLKDKQIISYATAITASKNYTAINVKQGAALIMGTENSGLTDNWLKEADQKIIIPMQEGIDSLNVSVSTAIIVYEIIRQRNFPNK